MSCGDIVRRAWPQPRCRIAMNLGLYAALAVFASWPLATRITSSFSIGFESEATVPLLNIWTLWWNADRLGSGLAGYWDAPIFYPAVKTFAFSEAQPPMLGLAPVVWVTGNPVLAYNIYLLLILTLNGWAAQRLLERWGHGIWLALCGGILCEMLPFVWWQSGVIQLTTLCGPLWTIHALIDLFDPDQLWRRRPSRAEILSLVPRRLQLRMGVANTPIAAPKRDGDGVPEWSWKRGLRLGAAFGLTYLLCNYWGLYLVLVMVPASIWLWNRRLMDWQFWAETGLAALLAAILILPIVRVQRSLAKEHTWTRDRNWIVELSAHPRDYLDTPETRFHDGAVVQDPNDDSHPAAQLAYPWSLTARWEPTDSQRNNLWPLGAGLLKLVLAPLGLVASLITAGRRRWGLFALTLGGVAFGWSLGPTVALSSRLPWIGGLCPYDLAQLYVPGFSLIRSPFRFAIFVQFATVVLSLEALDLLNPARWSIQAQLPVPGLPLQPATTRNWASTGVLWLVLVPISLQVVREVWPQRQGLYTSPANQPVPAWILWLRENSQPSDAVICLPFPTGYSVQHYEETAVWMYWGMYHRRPLVNGYSGFFPMPFQTLKEHLSQFYRAENEPPDTPPELRRYGWESPGLIGVNASGARFVIVSRSFATRDDVWQHPLTKFRWSWLTSDEEHQLDVYEILQPDS